MDAGDEDGLEAQTARLDALLGYQRDYEGLRKSISELPQRTHHSIMVPIGKAAIMPGKLVRTNEVMVLLGDNYFAKRSAAQACGILDRRIQHVEKLVAEQQHSMDTLHERQILGDLLARQMKEQLRVENEDGDEIVEIHEEYLSSDDDEPIRSWTTASGGGVSQMAKHPTETAVSTPQTAVESAEETLGDPSSTRVRAEPSLDAGNQTQSKDSKGMRRGFLSASPHGQRNEHISREHISTQNGQDTEPVSASAVVVPTADRHAAAVQDSAVERFNLTSRRWEKVADAAAGAELPHCLITGAVPPQSTDGDHAPARRMSKFKADREAKRAAQHR